MGEVGLAEWDCEKVMPCSCGDNVQDMEMGEHLRLHEQDWVDKYRYV
jgi:hypothetical protein